MRSTAVALADAYAGLAPPAVHGANRAKRRFDMTLCPIAIAVGCKKCPAFAVCPVKSIIGDYNKDAGAKTGSRSSKTKSGARPSK